MNCALSSARVAPQHVESGPVVRRACSCGGSCESCQQNDEQKLQRSPERPGGGARGGRDFSRIPATRSIHVRVGPADDAFEREADRIADTVVGGADAAPASAAPASAQRDVDDAVSDAPVNETAADVADEGEEGEDEGDATGRPKLESGMQGGGMAHVPVGSSSGLPLPQPVRAPFEARMGHDFTRVRIHSGGEAARAAAAVHARAFTVGSDIYFGAGRYDTGSTSGRRLLAHELAHVMQQSNGTAAGVQRQEEKTTKPAEKKATKKKTTAKKSENKPCAKDVKCEGCAAPSNAFAVHPNCNNETCAPSAAANAAFFIRHLDVDLTTQQTTAEWGDAKKTISVSRFLTSPNPAVTPLGSHKIDQKCTACHTNMHGSGMGWFTGFANSLEFGFHNSQAVAKGTKSHGCVRVSPCACAKEIHDNTDSGTTTVCIHKGKHCGHPLPAFGKADTKNTSVCANLFEALPPPAPAPATKGKTKGKAKGSGTPTPKQQSAPPTAPPAKSDAAGQPVAGEDVLPEGEEEIA